MTDASPPPKPFFAIDLNENGGKLEFSDPNDILIWANKEKDYWDFIWEGGFPRKPGSPQHEIWGQINQIISAISKLISQRDDREALGKIKSSFGQYVRAEALHSTHRYSSAIKIIQAKFGNSAASAAFAAAKDAQYSPTSRQDYIGYMAFLQLTELTKLRGDEGERQKFDDTMDILSSKWNKTLSDLEEKFSDTLNISDRNLVDLKDILRKRVRFWRIFRDRVRSRHQADRAEMTMLKSDLQNTIKALLEDMRLKAPVEYWTKKKSEHIDGFKKIINTLIIYVAITFFAFIGFTNPLLEKITQSSHEAKILIGALVLSFITILFWAGRILVRLMLSHIHLATDAGERATMVQTYLALTKENVTSEGDRSIVLSALFRQTTDGVVKDDGSTDVSLSALLAKFIDKK